MVNLDLNTLLAEVENTLNELHEQQTAKARRQAHKIRPDLTSEDLLNPDNFIEVISDPNFMYEDGIAAGILSAKIALRARIKEME
jgi:hypothetical protein